MKRLKTLATCWKNDVFNQWLWALLKWQLQTIIMTFMEWWPRMSHEGWVQSALMSDEWWLQSAVMSDVEPTQKTAETVKKSSKCFLTTNSILATNMFFCQQPMKTWMSLWCQWFLFDTNHASKSVCYNYAQLWNCKLYIHM